MTSTISLLKINYFANMLCNNKQFGNAYISIKFTIFKFISSNKIFYSKANKSTSYMISNIVFIRKVNNNNNNFKLIFCCCIYRAGRFFAIDNENQEYIINYNIAGLQWL